MSAGDGEHPAVVLPVERAGVEALAPLRVEDELAAALHHGGGGEAAEEVNGADEVGVVGRVERVGEEVADVGAGGLGAPLGGGGLCG